MKHSIYIQTDANFFLYVVMILRTKSRLKRSLYSLDNIGYFPYPTKKTNITFTFKLQVIDRINYKCFRKKRLKVFHSTHF